MASDEDKIYSAFAECPLAPLQGLPTYEYLTALNVYLNSCSSSVPCALGCGTLGFLVLTAQPSIFTTHCATPFIKPVNPGIHPTIPTPPPSAVVLAELVRAHKNRMKEFQEYNAMDRAIKRVISKLIPEKFYKSLASRLIGFSKITGLEILTHLITEYAELDDEAIQLIDKNMKTPINGETLFEDFIEQIEWNQEAVAVQNPYTPEQILSMAVSNVKKSGLYTEDCRDWDRKAANTKDWASFKVHFAQAFKDVRKSHETSHTGGYAANVSEAHRNAEMFAEMQQDHSSALANLATATQSDREAVSLLSKTIAELTKQIATLTTKLDSANTTIISLQGGGGNRTGRGNRDRGRNDSGGGNNNNGGGGGENKSDRNVWSRSGRKFNTNGYCHSHGFKVEEDHHSGNCTRRCEGHDATATRMNTKGGKQWNKDWINGGPTE